MWEYFSRYPSVRIEDIATPYVKGLHSQNVVEYDYIIVGGGTAGCVLANRLSANPSVSVLLLERGERNDGIIAGSAILSLPPVGVLPAKAITIAPQKHLSPRNQDVYESLCLGGRTRINAGLFLQGCPAEYENWGKGWQWEDVAPFFERLEGRLELEKRNKQPQNDTVEGRECKTRVMKAKYESSRQFAQALNRMGVPTLEAFTDPNTPTCFGIYQRRSLNSSGRRCSTYHGYLPKSLVLKRKNLTICLGAHVQQILLSDTANLQATGLLIEGNDPSKGLFTVRARHEIILSAGAIVTPQLLLLSGIGPKKHLSEVHKPCIHDLPGVGSTLQDHVYLPVTFFVPRRDSIHRLIENPLLAILVILQFFLFGTGLFLSMISEYFCFLHSDNLPPSHNPSSRALPDLEIFWTACYGSNSYPKLPKGKGGGSMMIQKSLPKSVGTVRLSTEGANDVKIDPIVDPNLLSNPEDWITYRRGLLYARQIGAEMARGGYDISEVLMPKSSHEEDLDEFIRNGALCSQHLLSSCRMKPLEEGGVVDLELRVYGIRGLRIADGSVFPGMVASRPQATVVMIAERCAEFIRREWSNWEFQSK